MDGEATDGSSAVLSQEMVAVQCSRVSLPISSWCTSAAEVERARSESAGPRRGQSRGPPGGRSPAPTPASSSVPLSRWAAAGAEGCSVQRLPFLFLDSGYRVLIEHTADVYELNTSCGFNKRILPHQKLRIKVFI